MVHKYRPDLIDYDSLSPSDTLGNLNKAMTAAGQFFGLEPYIQASDIAKLDEKSMLVYVSEYYSGITEQLKLELASRRLAQLIAFTMTNDELKATFLTDGQKLSTRLAKAEQQLQAFAEAKSDTMGAARSQLTKFTRYRSTEKRDMYSEHIKLEAIFTNLATRLADNSRPAFVPGDPNLQVDVRADRLKALQVLEQSVGLVLHQEVSRQHRLRQQDDEHNSRYQKLVQWVQEREANLPQVSGITSSGQARNLLKFLDNSAKEIAALDATSVAKLRALSAGLEQERFEFVKATKDRETELQSRLVQFTQLLKDKRPGFEDALLREETREQVRRLLLPAQLLTTSCNALMPALN